ncbi:LAMI_0G02124g1_1 [Lachancea mirantina]|uniref:LAMI_0G02124g1_1 n=1 Tax=Lachancea mirantina TaxID=1230905 RepID=A0A1G4K7P1_9SACH|nr:LAMI_0G02124g1_1 [Lachancea mirantina]
MGLQIVTLQEFCDHYRLSGEILTNLMPGNNIHVVDKKRFEQVQNKYKTGKLTKPERFESAKRVKRDPGVLDYSLGEQTLVEQIFVEQDVPDSKDDTCISILASETLQEDPAKIEFHKAQYFVQDDILMSDDDVINSGSPPFETLADTRDLAITSSPR